MMGRFAAAFVVAAGLATAAMVGGAACGGEAFTATPGDAASEETDHDGLASSGGSADSGGVETADDASSETSARDAGSADGPSDAPAGAWP